MINSDNIQFLRNIPKNKPIVIYGAGGCGDFIYHLLKEVGLRASCYAVSDGLAHKKELNGIKIYEISDLPYKKDECVIIVSIMNAFTSEIVCNIKNAEYEYISIFSAEDLSNIFRNKIQEWFEKNNIDLNDETIKIKNWEIKNLFQKAGGYSFAFFSEVGDCVLPSIMGDFSQMNEGAYEYEEITLEYGDVVFDCGANIGLASSVAASKGCYIYAFEPLENIIETLEQVCFKYMESIKVCRYALCDYVGKTNFDINADKSSSSMKQKNDSINSVEVNTITVDEFVKKNNIKKLDFIKADIEGAERLMLKGAKNTLKTLSPKLAICTYHHKDDPEVLEKIIKEANQNYVVKHKWKKLFAYVPQK